MARLLVALAISVTACHSASGPHWPKPSPGQEDGGESLAPRKNAAFATAIEQRSDAQEPAERTDQETVPARPAAVSPVVPAPAAAPAQASQAEEPEPVITEEIVIEIEEE